MHCLNPLRVVGCLVLLALSSALVACDSRSKDKQTLQALVDTHAKANEAKDGATMARILSTNTFDHYARNIKLALDGSQSEIHAATVVDRIEVARMRSRMTRKQLAKMSGKDYLIFATSEGWYSFGVGAEDVTGVDLTNFKFAGADTAYAQPRGGRRNKALPHRYTFIKEGADWKYDETSSYDHWSSEIEEDARRSNTEVNMYICSMVGAETGKQVPRTIFDKPMR